MASRPRNDRANGGILNEEATTIRCRIAGERGALLDSAVVVEGVDQAREASIIFESAGNTGEFARNPDYALALRLVLERLGEADIDIELVRAEVDSRTTSKLSDEERILQLQQHDLPISLRAVNDFESLRKDLTRSQRSVGQASGASGGNERKRMRLHLRSNEGELSPQALVFLVSAFESALDFGGLNSGPSFILTWNPAKWTWDDRDDEVRESQSGVILPGQWSTGNRTKDIHPGDRAYLIQQGAARGMVGRGYFASEVFQEPHWSGEPGKVANYALVVWDELVSEEDRLDIQDLKAVTQAVPWDNIQASGLSVSPEDASAIDTAWGGLDSIYVSPEEESGHTVTEGSVSRVEVNRYERSPVARRMCLEHHGYACSVCGMDFEVEYGDIGVGFIHVHHVVELSSIGAEYEVDPINDLRPVCPNCHAMLHTRRPAYSVEELIAVRMARKQTQAQSQESQRTP